MEKDLPTFEPYRGPGRQGNFLDAYVETQSIFPGSWSLDTPRFRIGDTRQDVRDLVRAALRDKYKFDALAAPHRRQEIKNEEERHTSEVLRWFDGLSDADAAHFFPRGPNSADTMRRDFIVEKFDRALALHDRMAQSRLTRFRIWALFMGREAFGDSSLFMPDEVAHFVEFRKGDSLSNIQTLASGYAQEASEDAFDHNRTARGNRLKHLAAELGRTRIFTNTNPVSVIVSHYPFEEIARDITGLDKRHKDDIHSTGDLF